MYVLEYPWLLAVLPLPLLVWWLLPPYREETPSVRLPHFHGVAEAAGVRPAPGAIVPKTNWLQKIVAPLCWALMVLALARPQFVEPPIQKIQPARDLLLSLDLSQSMDTKDMKTPAGELVARVTAVKTVVADFVKRRPGDRIGLIIFGDAPYPQVPFTLDHQTVLDMIDAMMPGMAGARTAMGDSIGLAIKMFEASQAPDKVLILLTDGNDTASKMPPKQAADIAQQHGIRIHTIGIGNPKAAGEQKLDVAMLQKVAATTGGRYFLGEDQQQLQQVYDALDRLTPANQKTLSWRPKRELFFYPLGAAVVLLAFYQLVMLTVLGTQRVMARTRRGRERAAA
jgi:Ca-activated chloride channel family protein